MIRETVPGLASHPHLLSTKWMVRKHRPAALSDEDTKQLVRTQVTPQGEYTVAVLVDSITPQASP